MDEQLIKRIALGTARDYLALKLGDRKGLDIYDLDLDDEELKPLIAEIERECAESFVQFLARIDAERGKEAVAFRLTDGDDVEYNGIDQFSCGRTGGEPLFRSPTIPEGMTLVSTEILDRFPEINPSNYDHDDACALNAWGVELVLDAAQGEK